MSPSIPSQRPDGEGATPTPITDAPSAPDALLQSQAVAWLPAELVERHAVRWALAEGVLDVSEVPQPLPGVEPLAAAETFVAWAREHVMPHWQTAQVAGGVPLACPTWCEGRHAELLRGGVITAWDMGTTHDSEQLVPAQSGLDVRLSMLQNHPDEGPDEPVRLHIGGEVDVWTPADVRAVAAALVAAADRLEDAQR